MVGHVKFHVIPCGRDLLFVGMSEDMANVLLVCRAVHVNESVESGLGEQHAVTIFDKPERAVLRERLASADIIICSGMGLPRKFLDADALAAAPNLKLIQQFGVGKEVMDLAAAHARNVWVATLPEANSVAVAETGLFLIFALAKQLKAMQKALATGKFATPLGDEIFGKRYCIVGLGNIGSALSSRLRALGGEVVAVDHASRSGAAKSVGVSKLYGPAELHAALTGADTVILSVPYTNATHDLIGEREIQVMGPGARLVNLARGEIVHRESLETAIFSGTLSGYATDVGWDEPVDLDEPLWQQDNVIVTPHIGATTRETIDLNLQLVKENIRRVETGAEPLFLVTDDADGSA